MSEFKPVETMQDLAFLNDEEILQGYRDGWDCADEPGSDKSRSYWHGWRNAQTDKGRAQPDIHQQRLAAQYVGARSRGH
jgi:hypothetical protein